METELVLLDDTSRGYVMEAACKNESPDLFDTDSRESRQEAASRTISAKAVCAVCPVRAKCLADALANKAETGIWGGMTPFERGIIPRKRSGKRKKV